jgi:hypothetical protein
LVGEAIRGSPFAENLGEPLGSGDPLGSPLPLTGDQRAWAALRARLLHCWGVVWEEFIIDVQGKLGYPSTDTHAPVCFAPINGCI